MKGPTLNRRGITSWSVANPLGIAVVDGPGIDYTGATDSSAAVQAIFDALPARGGAVHFPDGILRVAGVTCSKPVTVSGSGGRIINNSRTAANPGGAVTTLIVNSTTANGITLSGPGSQVRDLAIVNVAVTAPTAGFGLSIENGYSAALTRVSVVGFYDCVHFEGSYGTIDSCHFLDPVHWGLRLYNDNTGQFDFGDHGISNCMIANFTRGTAPAAAVRWESGGGIRWSNNKIVAEGNHPVMSKLPIAGFDYGIDILAAPNTSTVEWEIIGGGISTFTIAGIRVGQQAITGGQSPGNFYRMTVTGVVFQGTGPATGILIGGLDAGQWQALGDVQIDDCVFSGCATGIKADNCRNIAVGTHTWRGSGVTVPVEIGSEVRYAVVQEQAVGTSYNGDLVLDHRRLGANRQAGRVEHSFFGDFYSNVVGTWQTLCFYDIISNDPGSAVLDIELTGHDYNFGAFYWRGRRTLLKANFAAGTITVATSGTDETVGATSHLLFQFVTTTQNRVVVQYQMTTGGTTLWGRARVQAFGSIERSHIGA